MCGLTRDRAYAIATSHASGLLCSSCASRPTSSGAESKNAAKLPAAAPVLATSSAAALARMRWPVAVSAFRMAACAPARYEANVRCVRLGAHPRKSALIVMLRPSFLRTTGRAPGGGGSGTPVQCASMLRRW